MSTNLLTWRELEALCEADELVRWSPNAREKPPQGRCLYLLPSVVRELEQAPWPASTGETAIQTRRRRSAMRTALERYCNGAAINLNRDLKELGSKDANRSMRGYWEFRSQGPMEETRLFGFFARPGAFVGTDFQPRGRYVTQADWDAQRASCEGRWDVLTKKRPCMTAPWPVRLRSELSVYLDRTDDS